MVNNLKNTLFILLVVLSTNVFSIERVQTIDLKKGWNAVYLEVDPLILGQDLSAFILSANPEGTVPIEIVTTYLPIETSVEFISSPDEEIWKQAGWHSWIRDDFPQSFLTNLYDLEAGQAYLVKSSRDFVWDVRGKVRKIETKWHANSFNFIGFQVGGAALSFHQLFQESGTAESLKSGPIYTLTDGKWEQTSLPDEAVYAGKAYWVFSGGAGEFQGTVELGLDGGSKVMNFLDIVNTKTITLNNTTNSEKMVTLSLEDNEVPLSLIERDEFFRKTYTPVTDTIKTFTLPENSETLVNVAIRRGDITTAGKKQGVLKMVVEDTQEVQRLPISAYGDTQ